MRTGFNLVPSSLWLLATVALVAACADPTPGGKKKDAGHTAATCSSDDECEGGNLCVNNICTENTCNGNDDCPAGYECNSLTAQCTRLEDPDGGPPGDGGPGCAGRCDCTGDNEVCVAGKCRQAASDNSCVRDDQCPLGTICDFSHQCVPGCADACDCTGGKICNTTKLQCESCSRNNPCPSGQQCNASGECEAAVQCSSNAECADGQVCKNSVCGFCASDNDCKSYGNSFICSTAGLCVDNQCTDDSCQASSGDPKAYCNTSTNTCDFYECIGDSDCFNGDTCNTATHACEGSNPTCSADCNGQDCQSLQMICDPSTCTCTTNTNTNLCGPQNAGLAVKPDCTACTITDLLFGICVDAADTSYACEVSPIGLFLGFLGLVICE